MDSESILRLILQDDEIDWLMMADGSLQRLPALGHVFLSPKKVNRLSSLKCVWGDMGRELRVGTWRCGDGCEAVVEGWTGRL
eukprot:scaffold259155_cov28-Tisochrysis_lutea.AAC.1